MTHQAKIEAFLWILKWVFFFLVELKNEKFDDEDEDEEGYEKMKI